MLVLPLASRELLRECRHRIHFISRALFVAALVGFVVWRWYEAFPLVPASMSRTGTLLFSIWAVAQFAAATIFSLVRAATIADERRTGSLPLIRLTMLRDRGVILGAFVSVLSRTLFTMALSFPVLVIINRVFRGFTLEQLLVVTAMTALAAAHVAALTLFIAIRSRSAGAAMGASAVVQGIWLVLALAVLPEVEWLSAFGFVLNTVQGWSEAPDVAIFTPWMPAPAPSPTVPRGFWVILASRAVLTLLYLDLAAVFLKRPVPQTGRRIKRLLVAADAFFIRLSRSRAVLWRSGLGPCRGNPILWRERAVSLLGQRDHVIRLLYWALLAFLIALGCAAPFIGYEAILGVAVIGVIMLPTLVFAASLVVRSGTAFTTERRQQALRLLAVTPLTATRIVLGKYLFALRMLWVPVALGLIILGCAVYVDVEFDVEMVLTLLLVVVVTVMVSAQILYVGVAARTAAQGIAAGALLLVGAVLFAFPTARSDIMDLVFSEDPARLPGSAYLLATAGAVIVALFASRLRLFTSALLIALLAFAVPQLAAELGLRGPETFLLPEGITVGLLQIEAAAIVAVVVVIVVVVLRILRRRLALPVGVVGLLVVSTFVLVWQNDVAVEVGLFWLLIVVALVRAVRYAGPGIANRTILALIAPWVLNLLCPFLFDSPMQRLFQDLGYGLDLPHLYRDSLLLRTALMILATVVFLWATIRQLDRLIERHG